MHLKQNGGSRHTTRENGKFTKRRLQRDTMTRKYLVTRAWGLSKDWLHVYRKRMAKKKQARTSKAVQFSSG